MGPRDANLCFIRFLSVSPPPPPVRSPSLPVFVNRAFPEPSKGITRQAVSQASCRGFFFFLVRAERQHRILNLARARRGWGGKGGGFGEGLNQIRERAWASQPKNLPSSPLTDVRCALEADHSGCNLEEVRAPSNFQEALPTPPPPTPPFYRHYFLFACVHRETLGRAQRAKMAAHASPFPAFHAALHPPPPPTPSTPRAFWVAAYHSTQLSFSQCVGVSRQKAPAPKSVSCLLFLFHPPAHIYRRKLRAKTHTHTHARTTSLCLHSRQSK